MERTTNKPLSAQIKKRTSTPVKKKPELEGNTDLMISTGSTLLDLAISGGRIRGGGIPGGIMVEIFGPAGSGKTVLLCEAAGYIQRKGGDVMFHDPEARLNQQFAQIFDMKIQANDYSTPDTIPEVFSAIRKWEPHGKGVNGIMADSLAALSTNLEMSNEEGDKMGMRRAKEFSEELRKTARILTHNNHLLICSNQIRETMNTIGPKYKSPGGEALAFYASLRLRTQLDKKIKKTKTIAEKEVDRIVGITINVDVHKSSVWKPHRSAPVTIIFDYGIDDIRENLQFVKRFTKATTYIIGENKLDRSLEKSIAMVEDENLEGDLKEQVIDLWEEIESKFESDRKKKKR